MAFPFSILLALGAAASVVGTVGAVRAQNRAADAQEKQQQLERRRSNRQAVRQSQIARASALASATAAGSAGGSGFQGGIGSESSRLGAAQGFASQYSGLSGVVTRQTQRASAFSGLSSIGGSMMNLGYQEGGSFSGLFPGVAPGSNGTFTGDAGSGITSRK